MMASNLLKDQKSLFEALCLKLLSIHWSWNGDIRLHNKNKSTILPPLILSTEKIRYANSEVHN